MPADAKFWMWNDYVIEDDWDFGFVEVSTDGGTTWTDQPVFNEDGSLATTGPTYSDPNGNLRGAFGRENGLTARRTAGRTSTSTSHRSRARP